MAQDPSRPAGAAWGVVLQYLVLFVAEARPGCLCDRNVIDYQSIFCGAWFASSTNRREKRQWMNTKL